jgi:plastocyanin
MSEPHHGARDGEVSVALLDEAVTSYTFARRGTYYVGCHLPGHWAYGMKGRVVVS